MEQLNVNAVIREVLTLAGHEFLWSEVGVQTDLTPDVPGDPVRGAFYDLRTDEVSY
jgi:hypothetical protein